MLSHCPVTMASRVGWTTTARGQDTVLGGGKTARRRRGSGRNKDVHSLKWYRWTYHSVIQANGGTELVLWRAYSSGDVGGGDR